MLNHEIDNPDFAGQTERQIKIGLTLRNIAQTFFQKESSGTKADISRDLKHTDIYITVLPKSKEAHALAFAKRMRTDLRTEIKKKLQIRTIPNVEIKIDEGEIARQMMDNVFRKAKNN